MTPAVKLLALLLLAGCATLRPRPSLRAYCATQAFRVSMGDSLRVVQEDARKQGVLIWRTDDTLTCYKPQ